MARAIETKRNWFRAEERNVQCNIDELVCIVINFTNIGNVD